MSDPREQILSRIRASLADVPGDELPADVPVSRDYRRQSSLSAEERVSRFVERVRDYGAQARQVGAGELASALATACRELGCRSAVVPIAAPDSWHPAGVDVVKDQQLTAGQLDAIDAAITGCATAIAETGTIILDGQGRSGRRAITLVPDHHICVVGADQIHGSVPEAIAALASTVAEKHIPVTLISGPSASSDIELSRVEGVHGPRHLVVLVVDDGGRADPGV